jgi:hypothetical protein
MVDDWGKEDEALDGHGRWLKSKLESCGVNLCDVFFSRPFHVKEKIRVMWEEKPPPL